MERFEPGEKADHRRDGRAAEIGASGRAGGLARLVARRTSPPTAQPGTFEFAAVGRSSRTCRRCRFFVILRYSEGSRDGKTAMRPRSFGVPQDDDCGRLWRMGTIRAISGFECL